MAAPKGNKNALQWTLDKSVNTFKQAIELSKMKENYTVNGKTVKGYKYHFIGEIASELDLYRDLFLYLSKTHKECAEMSKILLNTLESNCFSDSKKGIIKEATAIMNLKSNYKWTDRLDNTTKGEQFSTEPAKIVFSSRKEE